jgi:thioester reductase-like protein
LRQRLQARLPAHLVPETVVVADALPRRPNGKLDLAALACREAERREEPAAAARPQTETEVAVAGLWGEVLGVERVGAEDNFFDLGGHSLLIARLLHRVLQRFGLRLPLRRLFEAPTLRRFAEAVDAARHGGSGAAAAPPDLAADSRLDPALRPPPDLAAPRPTVTDLFLTGATGFVGCFLVEDLLRQTEATLHCLVRGPDAAAALERLRARLRGYGLDAAAESARLRTIPGDLALPRFGLPEGDFDRLAERVDAIVHSGAHVNFLYPYEALRAVNVGGTREVLRLAQRGRLKPVHHVSTVGVFGGRGSGLYLEDDPLTEGPPLRGGYSQSKWVAERLVAQARERGLPASIYRLGTVTGHSTAGTANPGDFLSRLLRGCLALGLAPDVTFSEDMTPVDYVAAALVRLAFRGEGTPRTYHLINRERFCWPELVGWLADLGYPVRVVAPADWVEAVRAETNGDTASALGPLLPLLATLAEEALAPDAGSGEPAGPMRFDARNTEAGLAESPLACPRLEVNLLRRYLDYFVRTGALRPPRVAIPLALTT